jgi:hypothetical protein
VFTARYALSPYMKQTSFVFKGLNNRKMLREELQFVYNTDSSYSFHLILKLFNDNFPTTDVVYERRDGKTSVNGQEARIRTDLGLF